MMSENSNILKSLSEQEREIERLLEVAISKYGSEHVDLNLVSVEGQEPILDIIYHSSSNSFGINTGLSTRGVDYRVLDRLADSLDIAFNDYDADFDWRELY